MRVGVEPAPVMVGDAEDAFLVKSLGVRVWVWGLGFRGVGLRV